MSFLDRKSILWWAITRHKAANRSRRERIAQLPPSIRVHELRSADEVRALLEEVAAVQTSVPMGADWMCQHRHRSLMRSRWRVAVPNHTEGSQPLSNALPLRATLTRPRA